MKYATPLALAALIAATGLAVADEASHRKATEEMFKVMRMEEQLSSAIDQMLDLQTKANPALAKKKGVMRRFLAKHMSYNSLKDDLIKAYTESFTESEIKEITAFHRTPTVQKMLKQVPNLMRKGGEMGMKRVQENIGELKKTLAEEDAQ